MLYELVANNILSKSNNISWTSDSDSLGIQLSFDSLVDLKQGTIVSLFINNKEIFRTSVLSRVENKFSYSYTCLDFTRYLKNETIKKQFNDTPASNAITSLLREYNIKNSVVSIPTKIKKIYSDQSINEIIDDILEQATNDQNVKYYKETNLDTLIINKLHDSKIYPTFYIQNDFTINSSLENMINKVVVISEKDDDVKILATAEDSASIKKYGLLQMVEKISEEEVAKAKNIANNLLKENDKVKFDTSLNLLVTEGAEIIRANRLIQINNGKLNGWYKIKSATHTLSNGMHTISISLEF